MIWRYMVSGVVAAAAFVVPMVIGVEPEMHLTSSLMTAVLFKEAKR